MPGLSVGEEGQGLRKSGAAAGHPQLKRTLSMVGVVIAPWSPWIAEDQAYSGARKGLSHSRKIAANPRLLSGDVSGSDLLP